MLSYHTVLLLACKHNSSETWTGENMLDKISLHPSRLKDANLGDKLYDQLRLMSWKIRPKHSFFFPLSHSVDFSAEALSESHMGGCFNTYKEKDFCPSVLLPRSSIISLTHILRNRRWWLQTMERPHKCNGEIDDSSINTPPISK